MTESDWIEHVLSTWPWWRATPETSFVRSAFKDGVVPDYVVQHIDQLDTAQRERSQRQLLDLILEHLSRPEFVARRKEFVIECQSELHELRADVDSKDEPESFILAIKLFVAAFHVKHLCWLLDDYVRFRWTQVANFHPQQDEVILAAATSVSDSQSWHSEQVASWPNWTDTAEGARWLTAERADVAAWMAKYEDSNSGLWQGKIKLMLQAVDELRNNEDTQRDVFLRLYRQACKEPPKLPPVLPDSPAAKVHEHHAAHFHGLMALWYTNRFKRSLTQDMLSLKDASGCLSVLLVAAFVLFARWLAV